MSAPAADRPAASARNPRPRRWPRRLAVSTTVPVMAVAAAAGGGYAYLPARLGSIQRIAVSGLVGPNGPGQVFLIAGSNSRAGESAAAARHFGSAAQVAALGPDTVLSGPAGRDASRR